MIERPVYGGNAFLYFRSCFARSGPPMPIYPMQPIPQNPIQSGPPPVPVQVQPTDPKTPPAPPDTSVSAPQDPPSPSAPFLHRIGAICNDMTRSFAIGRGACSFHHGVNHWLYA